MVEGVVSFNDSLEELSTLESNLTELLDEYGESDEYLLQMHSVRVTFAFLYSVVFVLCVFGNLIVLIVVTTHWRMRHRITKFCLANLALADFCVGIFCVYQNLSTYFVDNWILGDFLCKLYQFINGTSHTASILTLVVVCVEHYLAVIMPLRCKKLLTKTWLKVLVVTVWLISGLYSSPRLYLMGTITIPLDRNGTETETICAPKRQSYDSQLFDVINAIFLFIVPLFLMTALYTRVGLVLWGSKSSKLHFSAPTLNRPIFTECSSTETETFGISPFDRVIENPISKKQRKLYSPPSGRKFNAKGFHSTRSKKFHLSQRPGIYGQKIGGSHGNRLNKVQLTSHCGKSGYASKKHSGTHNNPFGINSIRRTYFLKKIQARKQLRMEKYILQGQNELKVRRSVVKMLIVIVTTFAICNFPYRWRKLAIYWYPSYSYGSSWGTLTLLVSSLLMYGNCAMNPIIYVFMSSSFRACVTDVVHCQWRKPVSVNTSKNIGSSLVVRSAFKSEPSFRNEEV